MSKLANTNPKSHYMNKHRKDVIFAWCLLAVPLLNFLVFFVWTNFNSIVMAFRLPNQEGFTLKNFERFIIALTSHEDGDLVGDIGRSFILFGVGIFINMPIVLFSSYIMFKKVAGYKIYRVLFYLPSILGTAVMTSIFRYLVDSGGPLEQLLLACGVQFDEYLGLLGDSKTGFSMIITYSIWTAIGSNLIMYTGAMNRVPQDIFESARIDGVGFWREFISIIIPLIWPTITTMVVNSMTGIFSNYALTQLLAPNTPGCSTIGWYMFRYTMAAGNNTEVLNYPAAIGIVFTIVAMPMVLGTRYGMEKLFSDVEY